MDGQGGGIGATIIRRIREGFGEKLELWALGTNAIAISHKFLLPLTQEPMVVVGTVREPLPHLVEKLVSEHLSAIFCRELDPKCR